MTTRYTQHARVSGFGSAYHGHRVAGLTDEEKQFVRDGGHLLIAGCPSYRGETDRQVVEINRRFYCRMPQPQPDTSALESIIAEFADLLISQASTPEPYPGATTDERWGFWFDAEAWYGLTLSRTARQLCGV